MFLRLPRVELGLVTLTLVVTCWACTGGSSVKPPEDAGGAEVIPPRPDASSRDATVDAGPNGWLRGDWDRVPGASDRCDVLAPRSPGRDLTPLKWKACPSGRSGCELVDIDWTPLVGYTFYADGPEPVRQGSDGVAYLCSIRVYPKASDTLAPEHAMIVVEPLSGGAPATAVTTSLGTRSDCSVELYLTDAGVRQTLFFDESKKLSYRSADWATPNSFKSPVDVPYGPTGGTPGPGVANTSHALVTTSSPDGWALVDYVNGSALLPKDGAARMFFEAPLDLPGGFLARYAKAAAPIVNLKDDGTFVPLLTASGAGRSVTGYAVDRTQGNALVWVEATGVAPSTSPVLYTSTFAASAAGLVPRKVTAYDEPNGAGGSYMVAAHGTAVLRVSNTRALVVRLSDGASWTLDAEPGMGFGAPVWVDEQRVWLNTGKLYADGGGVQANTLLRISRSSLGSAMAAR